MKFIVRDFRILPVEEYPTPSFLKVDGPEQTYYFYKQIVEKDLGYEPEKEHVVVITLGSRMNPTGWHMVSIGGFSEAACHPREVLRPVIVRGATSFILCHNHPSGDPRPSRADEMVTRRLNQAAEIMQISLTDHIIIGDPAPGRAPYFSFRESGFF